MKFAFVKRNWEKIALGVVLAFFVLALVWLVNLFYESREARTTGVTVIASKSVYSSLPREFYDFSAELTKSALWIPSVKRDTNTEDDFYIATYTDFMKPFRIARSNAPKADGKLIPYEYYKLGYCPITKEKLQIAQDSDDDKTLDSDGDGIPDQLEKKYGLNPANGADANYDMDSDSFTNLQEYLYDPNGINNPKIHPPLIRRVILAGISKAKVPFIVKNFIKSGKDKSSWNIQVNFEDPSIGTRTQFLKIGSTIDLPGISYKITDINDSYYERLDPKLGTMLKVDNSTVIFQTSKGDRIQAQVNKVLYEKDNLVTIRDVFSGEESKIRINDKITLGNTAIGIEEYTLTDIIIDDSKKEEKLLFEKNGQSYYVKNTTDYVKPLPAGGGFK